MTGVLHVQTRSYPLHYTAPQDTPDAVDVPGHGRVRAVPGTLGSLAYNPEALTELDLTGVITAKVNLPGVEIVGCRARVLDAGSVLVSYALRHDADLRAMPVHELDALDARVNNTLRDADTPILAAVLAAAVESGLISDLVLRPDRVLGGAESPMDRRSVRYNCHFVTEDPPWACDPRFAELVTGPKCRILLSYTYAWDADPDLPLAEVLTMMEPTDIATAQQSLLIGAVLGGRRILVDLAREDPKMADVHAFRNFLDRVWSDYHYLDTYRIESGQQHRVAYMAARQCIGLDDTESRADKLLGYVGNSLVAASSHRAEALDQRLNRVASALAVVASAAFVLDATVFLLSQQSLIARVTVVPSLVGLIAIGLIALILPRSARRTAKPKAKGARAPRPRAVARQRRRSATPAAVPPAHAKLREPEGAEAVREEKV
ncbi:hypothetical protein [Glycomyces paridis]|uniref:Uncharacterized protein n=1 Tax=Glycomyces paridis TaxID=2126555 RepID=A0A4S8P2Z0_9ACTN|nr:hypothetical protein [Glycomyces paridis]THV22054.1 hypothetical protein E9998_23835 [Glycomyces paridis]